MRARGITQYLGELMDGRELSNGQSPTLSRYSLHDYTTVFIALRDIHGSNLPRANYDRVNIQSVSSICVKLSRFLTRRERFVTLG